MPRKFKISDSSFHSMPRWSRVLCGVLLVLIGVIGTCFDSRAFESGVGSSSRLGGGSTVDGPVAIAYIVFFVMGCGLLYYTVKDWRRGNKNQ